MTFDIRDRVRLREDLVYSYRSLSTATIGHLIEGHAMDRAIRPVGPSPIVAGPAVTIRTLGRDSTVCHKVIDLVQAGDILIVDRGGDQLYACWGEMMTIAAHRKGAAAVIVDGPVTDLAALRQSPLPVFSRGVSPLATQLLGEGGSVNVAVDCGGLRVSPGDLVVADDDGVLVFAPEEAAAILPSAQEEAHGEVDYREQLLRGITPSSLAPIDELILARADA